MKTLKTGIIPTVTLALSLPFMAQAQEEPAPFHPVVNDTGALVMTPISVCTRDNHRALGVLGYSTLIAPEQRMDDFSDTLEGLESRLKGAFTIEAMRNDIEEIRADTQVFLDAVATQSNEISTRQAEGLDPDEINRVHISFHYQGRGVVKFFSEMSVINHGYETMGGDSFDQQRTQLIGHIKTAFTQVASETHGQDLYRAIVAPEKFPELRSNINVQVAQEKDRLMGRDEPTTDNLHTQFAINQVINPNGRSRCNIH